MDEQPLQSDPQNELIPQTVPTETTPPYRHRSFSHKKSIISIIFLTLLLAGGLGIGLTSMGKPQQLRSKATNNGPVLTINPSTKTLDVGQATSLGIILNTNDDTASAVELHLAYDKTAIQVTGFTAGTILPVILKPATFTNGTVDVVLGAQPTAPFKGSGILGTMTIKKLSSKQSTLTFMSTTQVAAIGKTTNALASATGASIGSSGAGTGNSPTPTHMPGATNAPTPVASGQHALPQTPTNTTAPLETTSPSQNSADTNEWSPFAAEPIQKDVPKTTIFHQIFSSILEFFRKLF